MQHPRVRPAPYNRAAASPGETMSLLSTLQRLRQARWGAHPPRQLPGLLFAPSDHALRQPGSRDDLAASRRPLTVRAPDTAAVRESGPSPAAFQRRHRHRGRAGSPAGESRTSGDEEVSRPTRRRTVGIPDGTGARGRLPAEESTETSSPARPTALRETERRWLSPNPSWRHSPLRRHCRRRIWARNARHPDWARAQAVSRGEARRVPGRTGRDSSSTLVKVGDRHLVRPAAGRGARSIGGRHAAQLEPTSTLPPLAGWMPANSSERTRVTCVLCGEISTSEPKPS